MLGSHSLIMPLAFTIHNAYISTVGLTDYNDKRAYNKRAGPGGGTRRLHHKGSYSDMRAFLMGPK